MYDRARDTADQLDHTVGSTLDSGRDKTIDVTCGVFANVLGNKEDMRIFADRVKNVMPYPEIVKEAKAADKLLKDLAKIQGVPVKDLVTEMYPAMCSHIKA